MSNLYYEVDKADLKRVTDAITGAGKKAPNVIRNAINRTATRVKKAIDYSTNSAYTMKRSEYKNSIKILRATPSHLDAIIKATGKPRTLKEYKYTYPKSGVRSDITRSGLKDLALDGGGHAFMIGGDGLIAQRRGKDRLPIRVPKSVSAPKMVEKVYKGERGVEGDMEPKTRKVLHDEIQAEIKKLI